MQSVVPPAVKRWTITIAVPQCGHSQVEDVSPEIVPGERRGKQSLGERKQTGVEAIREEAEVANADETFRKHVEEEPGRKILLVA